MRYDPYDYEYLKEEKMKNYMKQLREEVFEKLTKLELLALYEEFDEFCYELTRIKEEDKVETYYD